MPCTRVVRTTKQDRGEFGSWLVEVLVERCGFDTTMPRKADLRPQRGYSTPCGGDVVTEDGSGRYAQRSSCVTPAVEYFSLYSMYKREDENVVSEKT